MIAHGRLIEVDPLRPETVTAAAGMAEEAVGTDGLVIMPTETVYGIACRPDRPEAMARLFEAKGRPRELLMPVLVTGVASAWQVAQPNPAAQALAHAFWPGPLTMVLPRTALSGPWDLGTPDAADSIAVRVPDHPVAVAILGRTGPLAATSANLSGSPPLEEPGDLIRTFGTVVSLCVLMAPGTDPPRGLPSTALDLTGDAVRVIRSGALDPAQARAELGRVLPGTQWVDFD
jgi:L-threonylcarbamoyladenylate synthase